MRALLVPLAALLVAGSAGAATSSGASSSPFSGNGHTQTFDGRLYVVAHGDGWKAQLCPTSSTPAARSRRWPALSPRRC